MYKYEWSRDGGFRLSMSMTGVINDIRPVFFEELDLLGFDKLGWKYPKSDKPLLWAEGRRYIYKGEYVAQLTGGSLYVPPRINIVCDNLELEPIDIEKLKEENSRIMSGLVQKAKEEIYTVYEKYHDKTDIVYIAFSGGKDSLAVLDLVYRALPQNRIKVIFGDTYMELSDTYKAVEQVKKRYPNFEFYTAKSTLDIEDSWRTFGPPSKKLRWCCSVHKFVPQMQTVKRIVGKDTFKSLSYIGVRRDESLRRADSQLVEKSKKFGGQINSFPIRMWNSAEVYLYLLANDLLINDAYRKGMPRVGCIFCPMSNGLHDYVKNSVYPDECDRFISLIKNILIENGKEGHIKSYIDEGEWGNRTLGKQLFEMSNYYVTENEFDDYIVYETEHLGDTWKEWIKTIGNVYTENGSYYIEYNSAVYMAEVKKRNDDKVSFVLHINKNDRNRSHLKILMRHVLRKACYCTGCGYCEIICPRSCITLGENMKIDGCAHCGKCLSVDRGCLVCNALRLAVNGGEKMGSVDRYKTFGFRRDWLDKYFASGDRFWDDAPDGDVNNKNALGSVMQYAFKNFLSDSEITDNKKHITQIGKLLQSMGTDNFDMWAVVLTNLSYTAEIGWYVKNIKPNIAYTNTDIKDMLGEDMTARTKSNILSAYKNIFETTPLGSELCLGTYNKNGKIITIERGVYNKISPIALIYSLYKFAEKCGEYYNFTLNYLCDESIEREGISPSTIFGLQKQSMREKLTAAAADYPEYLSVVFGMDLDNIDLNGDIKSVDVLERMAKEM